MLPLRITTLTPNAVQQNLQNNGLAALGLTTVALNSRWTDGALIPAQYDSTALTLNLPTVRVPFLSIRENAFTDASSTLAGNLAATATTLAVASGTGFGFPAPTPGGRTLLTLSNNAGSSQEIVECTAVSGDSFTIVRGARGTAKQNFSAGDRVRLLLTPAQRSSAFYGVDGSPINVHCTVLRFHPQAFARLQTVAAGRYAGAQPLTLPLPAAMIVRNAPGFRAARWYRPDEVLDDASGLISFHDSRGLIVDPIYVAGLFADLLGAFAGMLPPTVTATVNDPGGVANIATLATGILVHFIDPHGNTVDPQGNAPRIASPGAGLVVSPANTPITTPLVSLGAGDSIAANNTTTPLRFGFATNGTMGTTALTPPQPAQGSIARLFYRVVVVDTPWYLLGNRTGQNVLGVGPDDGRIPPELLPAVRDKVNIDYLVDGNDTVAEGTRILTRPSQDMILAVSPVIDQALVTPAQPGANAHWPVFPAPNTNAGFPNPPIRLSAANVTAAFTAGNDVVVTIAAGAAPDGATVRIFPQQFVEIASINGSEPSFVRADGGANIVVAGTPTDVLLVNPFNLAAAQPKPSPATLTMDLVVAPRNGRRRLTGALAINVATGPAAVPGTPFFGPPAGNIMGAMVPTSQGVAESPLFGIPTTLTPPAQPPGNFLDLVVSLASEAAPRQAPRLPTMARFETVAVTGTTGGTPAGTLIWQGALSGGRWAAESLSTQHPEGNPGNPAGPDVHAPAVTVSGALAYDLALHAARRAQSMIPRPLPGGGMSQGWVVLTAGPNFAEPSDAASSSTSTGVLLQTVAVGCETSWLSNFTTPAPGVTLDSLLQDAVTAMGGSPPPVGTITVQNEARIQQQVRREFFAAKQGFRDAQWSLRRAFAEARELVYIESPQFSRTARPAGSPQPYELDLVAVLADSLTAHPNLRVIICTPRFSDFSDKFRTFHRQHYAARMEALGDLQAAAKDRVRLFHPVGFPGRVAYIRTTSIIVDDVWCLVGATHFRRRGMTFDGSAAIASFDRQITEGYSTKVRNYRRALMAAKLNVPAPPAAGQPLSGEWVRLGSPASAFDVVSDLLDQGGFGRIQSIWPGPADSAVATAQPEVADPDGSSGATLFNTLAGMFNELGT